MKIIKHRFFTLVRNKLDISREVLKWLYTRSLDNSAVILWKTFIKPGVDFIKSTKMQQKA